MSSSHCACKNGWYVQRYAPMLRVAVPYGELSSTQLRVLARIAREYDQPDAALLGRGRLQACGAAAEVATPAALAALYGVSEAAVAARLPRLHRVG